MTADPALWGLGLWAVLCVAVVGGIFRRPPVTVAAWAASGVGFYLLGRNPHLGVTVLLALALWVVNRYGILHLIRYGGMAFLFAAIVWTNITGGMFLPSAVGNAADRMVWLVALIWGTFTVWQIVRGKLGYLANPILYGAETRRIRETAEYKRARGGSRRSLGWVGRRTRAAVTGRPPPALPRPPDQLDSYGRDDLAILAGRHGIDPEGHLTDELREKVREARQRPPEPATAHARNEAPAQAVDVDQLSPEPLFHHREPIWRWR
jgi:hypothetical protein